MSKHPTAATPKGRSADPSPAPDASRTATGVQSLAPPAYGLDFVDRGRSSGAEAFAARPPAGTTSLARWHPGPDRVSPESFSSAVVQCKTYVDGSNTWDADYKFTARETNAKTPYGLIKDAYAGHLKPGWDKKVTPKIDKADIPSQSTATKQGVSSSGARNQTPSQVETQVKYLGMTEQLLQSAGKNSPRTEYAGGHLVAWNILMGDSNVFANIAPQASTFNSPVYYNTFEQIGQYSAEKVKISVKLAYAQTTYDVDQAALVRKRILDQQDSTLPAKVTIPTRIPSDWEATAEVVDSSKQLGSTGKAQGDDVYLDKTKYDNAKITASNKRGYKMFVEEGADTSTGETGGARKRVKLVAKQLH
jgi:hypothetical protein